MSNFLGSLQLFAPVSGQTYARGAEICSRFGADFSGVGIVCPSFGADLCTGGRNVPQIQGRLMHGGQKHEPDSRDIYAQGAEKNNPIIACFTFFLYLCRQIAIKLDTDMNKIVNLSNQFKKTRFLVILLTVLLLPQGVWSQTLTKTYTFTSSTPTVINEEGITMGGTLECNGVNTWELSGESQINNDREISRYQKRIQTNLLFDLRAMDRRQMQPVPETKTPYSLLTKSRIIPTGSYPSASISSSPIPSR